MILGLLEYMLRFFLIYAPIVLLLLVYPDLTERHKTLVINGKKVLAGYNTTAPEKRHPNFFRWGWVYTCCYFGLYFSYFSKCQPDVSVLEFILSIIFSFFFVGDFMLGLVGLGEWAYFPQSNLCFQ